MSQVMVQVKKLPNCQNAKLPNRAISNIQFNVQTLRISDLMVTLEQKKVFKTRLEDAICRIVRTFMRN